MAKFMSFLYYFISSILLMATGLQCGAAEEDRQAYIVYMGSLPKGQYSPSSHHISILQKVLDGQSVSDNLIRSYKRSFNGFAAWLTDHERQKLASLDGIVSVFPSRTLQLHTTRSWDFMGLHENDSQSSTLGSDIVIGVIDTGIWPESESFNDEGFRPAPKKWKGACEGGKNFTCNNKIIGARYYTDGVVPADTARDSQGHGTHSASTAAGNKVKDVSFYGLLQGTARGGVPSARIAAYKVCYPSGCIGHFMLAAFDDAIADGVDIITVSLGIKEFGAVGFKDDVIAIGAFHAMEKGILTVNSAGNGYLGPGFPYNLGKTSSVAPWMLSVAASSIDRRLVTKAVLGNGTTLLGNSINPYPSTQKYPLLYGKGHCRKAFARKCAPGCLDPKRVKGKIVVCDDSRGGGEALRVGAIGSITVIQGPDDNPFVVPLPETNLRSGDYNVVMSYMNSTESPQATILKSEAIEDVDAPLVTSFSACGPNTIVPEILKPDVTAPGVHILSAIAPEASLLGHDGDKRSVYYSILSGTSVSCPHAAGAAAYIKSNHPDWSPSAIKSALLTTAWPMNATKNSGGEFAYGSGHINPIKAVDPGLVYETYKEDYSKMLCSVGYTTTDLRLVSGDNSTCPEEKVSPKDLNYPSMASRVPENDYFEISFKRTVTNVGLSNSTYTVNIIPHPKLQISVAPSSLPFKSLNEKKSFVVTVVGGGLAAQSYASASLVWSDGSHNVRSPIVVFTVVPLFGM